MQGFTRCSFLFDWGERESCECSTRSLPSSIRTCVLIRANTHCFSSRRALPVAERRVIYEMHSSHTPRDTRSALKKDNLVKRRCKFSTTYRFLISSSSSLETISLQTRILWKIYANVSRVRCTSRGNGREKLLNREISEQAIKSVKR